MASLRFRVAFTDRTCIIDGVGPAQVSIGASALPRDSWQQSAADVNALYALCIDLHQFLHPSGQARDAKEVTWGTAQQVLRGIQKMSLSKRILRNQNDLNGENAF